MPKSEPKQDIFTTRRPDAKKNASGLLGMFLKKENKWFQNYTGEIKDTVRHKTDFALVYYKLFGFSMNMFTHDSDKIPAKLLGMPHEIVTYLHRNHSSHHIESGKPINLKSKLCDDITSNPIFKPKNTQTLREMFMKSEELQNIKGYKELLEKYNYGEKLDCVKIIEKRNKILSKVKKTGGNIAKASLLLSLFFTKTS